MSVRITEFPPKANTSEPFVLKGTTTNVDDGDELLILVDDNFEVARPRVQGGKWEITLIFNQTGDRKIEVIASDQDRAEITLRLESGEIKIISRRVWGAKPPNNSLADLPSPKRITIHHTVFPTLFVTASQATEEQRMRDIQASEMKSPQNFSDIGYHYVIMPSGRIYEGRPNSKKGAHDVFNDGFGIAMEGSFHLSGSNITDEQFDSTVALCTQLCKKIGITDPTTLVSTPIDKDREPSPKSLPRIIGHRDRVDTICPGMGEARLKDLRQAVKARL
ncbi:peptidoglycan recognition family protein [Microcoleus sp. S36b_A3]|uniref:peptidoglycan recognition protein family protein n=1 Tax=unclassified Microcoleus TaxID=2642155 RepID=UPI002FD4C2C0